MISFRSKNSLAWRVNQFTFKVTLHHKTRSESIPTIRRTSLNSEIFEREAMVYGGGGGRKDDKGSGF